MEKRHDVKLVISNSLTALSPEEFEKMKILADKSGLGISRFCSFAIKNFIKEIEQGKIQGIFLEFDEEGDKEGDKND